MLMRAFAAGTIGGLLLGLSLKLAETFTGIKVYTLLLNVDFIPIIGDVAWSEPIEFFFHLWIAWLIAGVYAFLLEHITFFKQQRWLSALLLTLPTIPLYFPLTLLAQKETPSPTDGMAFFIWTAAHLLYMLTLPLCFPKKKNNSIYL